MSDLINRDAVLEAIDSEFFKTDPNSEEQLGFLTCRRIVREFSAETTTDVIHCDACAYHRPSPFGHPTIGWCIIRGSHRPLDYYCADADMRGDKE